MISSGEPTALQATPEQWSRRPSRAALPSERGSRRHHEAMFSRSEWPRRHAQWPREHAQGTMKQCFRTPSGLGGTPSGLESTRERCLRAYSGLENDAFERTVASKAPRSHGFERTAASQARPRRNPRVFSSFLGVLAHEAMFSRSEWPRRHAQWPREHARAVFSSVQWPRKRCFRAHSGLEAPRSHGFERTVASQARPRRNPRVFSVFSHWEPGRNPRNLRSPRHEHYCFSE